MVQNLLGLLVRLMAIALVALGITAPAQAQTVKQYTNTSDSAANGINSTSTPCTNPFQRTFTVASSFTIADVNIGVLAAHAVRGDLQAFLVHTDAVTGTTTSVRLINRVGGTLDNLNVLFDSSATTPITAHTVLNDTATATTGVPPYEHTFRPDVSLNAFNGKSSQGTWTLRICDAAANNSGTFYQADLYLTATAATSADLSLTKVVVGGSPVSGGNTTFRLTVTNSASSTGSATSVVVRDPIPTGFVLTSTSGTGTYDSTAGLWTVGTLAPGASATIDLIGIANSAVGSIVTNVAEIQSGVFADPDSTPGNGVTTEDDYASASYTVAAARQAGVPPMLTCPAGSYLFDWDPLTWPAGSIEQRFDYTANTKFTYTLTNPGAWLNNAAVGGQSPTLQTVVNGGFAGQESLIELVNLGNKNHVVTTIIALPTVMQGAQFRIFDVDFSALQFADKMTVVGRLGGATVMPVLTNGVTNYIVGDSAIGDGASDNGSNHGNVVVTFNTPIDRIEISYGNHTTAPDNPGQQGIALSDVQYCLQSTTLTVSKTSAVLSAPITVGGNPKAIPGAVIEYCITVTNPGAVAATAVVATDTLPTGVTYILNSLRSGTSCAAATNGEDDDASGADESDPFGVSFNAGTVIGTAATMDAGAAFSFKLQATID